MATTQVRLQAIFDNCQDAPQTQAYIDKRVDAITYNASEAEIAERFPGVTKATITANQKRIFALASMNRSSRDSVRKAASDAQDILNATATEAAKAAAEA